MKTKIEINMKALTGKVAVVTGAGNSAGIGFASAKK
jgi:NADP-dependent 3-hydroxy acid dehydrogenase YdfG